ncbi:hypothetical protein SRABI27_00230 [Pedobacter sp. Bi27]|nr:hypothetical protein SRABI27_00230 [Pedobacter sp. Bi27]
MTINKNLSFLKGFCSIFFVCTGNVEFLEHLSGFLEVLERILEKKKLQNEV